MSQAFEKWIDELDENMAQGNYGYECGEFTVFPDHRRQMFDEGLTPQQAFQRALDVFAAEGDKHP